ncbi:MAG: DUF11 domain-containing protein [Anaerolineae bacterium]|nr:DUF11 domain-containing protein [Anaerolineae bacterium]
MRRKVLVMLIIGLCVIAAGMSYTPSAYAIPVLQDAPRLDGYKIYFTEANGEASRFDRTENGLSRFAGLVRQMGATLETLEWRTDFPDDADLIIIAGPTTDFNADQTARLWNYMSNGGKVLLLADAVQNDRGRARGLDVNSGLFQLTWIDMGLRANNDLVLTEGFPLPEPVIVEVIPEATAEATAEVMDEATAEPLPTLAPLPQPIVNFTATELSSDHPITQGLSELAFFAARSIDIDLSVRDFPVEPLVFSDTDFYGENNFPEYYESGLAIYNIGEDIPQGFLPLATAYENTDTDLRFVLVGDREFATNGYGLQSSPPNTGSFIHADNIRFLFNSIAWLLDIDPIEANFPTPGPTATATVTPTPVVAGPPDTTSDLSLSLTVSNERPVEGELILYEVTAANNGPDPVTNVVLDTELPNGLDYVLSEGGTYDGTTGAWTIDILQPDESLTLRMLTMVRRGTVGTEIVNGFTIASMDSIDPDDSNNSAEIAVTVARVVLEEE